MSRALRDHWLIILALGAVASAPLVAPTVVSFNLASTILVWGLFALGFDIAFGLAGMLSFGHAALLGTGAYVFGLLVTTLEVNYYVALLGSAGAGAALAYLFSKLALRVSGLFFALLTLALAQLVYILVLVQLRSITGGPDGLLGIPRPAVNGTALIDDLPFYGFLIVVFAAGLAVAALLRSSAFGCALHAIRANPFRAAQLGFNVQRLREAALAVSGAFAGVSGALLGSLLFYVDPRLLHWQTSGDIMIMTVLGGRGTLLGPVLGVAFVELMRDWLSSITERWYGILGVIFVLVTIYLPAGLYGLLSRRSANERAGRRD